MITDELRAKLIQLCTEVSKDVENDVNEIEGKDFSGENVARMFGYQAAAIKALSDTLIKVINSI